MNEVSGGTMESVMKVKWFGRVLLAGLLCLVTGTVTA